MLVMNPDPKKPDFPDCFGGFSRPDFGSQMSGRKRGGGGGEERRRGWGRRRKEGTGRRSVV
jgi:hypothetical protein